MGPFPYHGRRLFFKYCLDTAYRLERVYDPFQHADHAVYRGIYLRNPVDHVLHFALNNLEYFVVGFMPV